MTEQARGSRTTGTIPMGARDRHKPCTRTNSTHQTQVHHDTTHRHHTGSCRQQDDRHYPVGSIRPPHTMAPGRSNIRHQDTTVTIHKDITKQASHSKAWAVAPQALSRWNHRLDDFVTHQTSDSQISVPTNDLFGILVDSLGDSFLHLATDANLIHKWWTFIFIGSMHKLQSSAWCLRNFRLSGSLRDRTFSLPPAQEFR